MPLVVVPVGAIVLALLALLLLLVFEEMVHNGVSLPLSRIPAIGGYIADGIDGAISAVRGYVEGWAEWGIKAMVDVIWTSGSWSKQLWDSAAGLAEDTEGAVAHLVTQSIPHAASTTLGWAGQLVSEAEGRATRFASGLADGLAETIRNLRSDMSQRFHEAYDDLGQLVNVTADAIRTDISAVAANAQAWADGAERAAMNTLGRTSEWLESEIAGVARQGELRTAAVWEDTQGLVGAAVEALDGEMLARDAAIAAAAAVATAAVATAVNTWIHDCGDPLCNGLDGLARLLPELAALLETGALLALVAEAINDPKGTAAFVEEESQPFISTGRSLLQSLGSIF